jgi:hypothetical protein
MHVKPSAPTITYQALAMPSIQTVPVTPKFHAIHEPKKVMYARTFRYYWNHTYHQGIPQSKQKEQKLQNANT